MTRKRVLFVFGTRPEAIKMAPVIHEFLQDREFFDTRICVTAQHREMLDQVLAFFSIVPEYDLDLMSPGQTLYDITAKIMTGMRGVLEDFDPDYVMVHGDTSSTMTASIAAFYHGAKVCHVEAGLRTFDMMAPFPEEMNRQVTGRISSIHFAPTEKARLNLLQENVSESSIIVTGNTVIDALLSSVKKVRTSDHPEIVELKKKLDLSKKIVLVTGHRRENFGQRFLNICEALAEIAEDEEVQIVYPVHLNPSVQKPVYERLGDKSNITLIKPLSYESFIWLMDKSYLIITDSGGVQEEAPSLGKPVLVMRDTTERPEAVEAGTVVLVGTDPEKIVGETRKLLSDTSLYQKMSNTHNPYGDGKASTRILKFLKENEK